MKNTAVRVTSESNNLRIQTLCNLLVMAFLQSQKINWINCYVNQCLTKTICKMPASIETKFERMQLLQIALQVTSVLLANVQRDQLRIFLNYLPSANWRERIAALISEENSKSDVQVRDYANALNNVNNLLSLQQFNIPIVKTCLEVVFTAGSLSIRILNSSLGLSCPMHGLILLLETLMEYFRCRFISMLLFAWRNVALLH